MPSLAPETEYEKYCPECGAPIPKTADICPSCGVRQLDVPAPKSSGTRVLLGCVIAVAVLFLAIPVIGMLAAIAIPKLASTKEKAYIAAMKSDLRDLDVAEQAFFADSGRYTSKLSRLRFEPSKGVSSPTIVAGKDYWTARVTHPQVRGRVCAIAVNTSNTLDPTAGDEEPACR